MLRTWTPRLVLVGAFVAGGVPALSGDKESVPSEAIDGPIEARLAAEGVKPAPPASDETFMRRAYLDLTGVAPVCTRVSAFLADKSKDRRPHLLDRLMASPEFDAWWGRFLLEVWTDGRRADGYDEFDGRLLHGYLARALAERRPLDAVARELLSAEGNVGEKPVEWLLRYGVRPSDLAGAVGRDMLGISIQCAQCHDHPEGKWKNERFWELAAFFSRARAYESNDVKGLTEARRASPSMMKPGDEEPPKEGDPPVKKKRYAPCFLDGSRPEPDEDLRVALGRFVTKDPLFARNLANRIWKRMLGAALVEPVGKAGDGTAKPVDPAVLDALARLLEESKFDLRAVVSAIARSRTYARASKGAGPKDSPFSRHVPRPLSADQLRATLIVATGLTIDGEAAQAPEPQEGEEPKMMGPAMKGGPESCHCPDLIPAQGDSQTPGNFGEPGTRRRGLVLLNGDLVRQAAAAFSARLVEKHGTEIDERHLEHAFLSLLARRPTARETERLLELIHEEGAKKAAEGEAPADQQALEDVVWALINSTEFVTEN